MSIDNNLIYFRKATIQDIEPLVNLRKILLSSGTSHYAARNKEEDEEWQKCYREWLLKKLSCDHILVAVGQLKDHPDICACAISIIDERAPYRGCLNGRMGWIQTMVVTPEMRRQGIAEKMLHYIFHWLKSHEVTKVMLQTTPIAKKLYEKMNFSDSDEELLIRVM